MARSKGEETRKVIVREAMDLVSTVGFSGLSIGRLARSLKMSKSGIWAHFQSNQQLQLEILAGAREKFISIVVSPALKQARGEPRIRAFFENYLAWERCSPGGCLFASVGTELDDQPGLSRDALVDIRRDWLDSVAQAARIAVDEQHFRKNLDVDQFAFEFWSLGLGFQQYSRLLNDPHAESRVRTAFNQLLDRCR